MPEAMNGRHLNRTLAEMDRDLSAVLADGIRQAVRQSESPSLASVRQILEQERSRLFGSIGASMRLCAEHEERLKAIMRDLEAERAKLADLQGAERSINAAIRAANAGAREDA